jgi:hypothetical protein
MITNIPKQLQKILHLTIITNSFLGFIITYRVAGGSLALSGAATSHPMGTFVRSLLQIK